MQQYGGVPIFCGIGASCVLHLPITLMSFLDRNCNLTHQGLRNSSPPTNRRCWWNSWSSKMGNHSIWEKQSVQPVVLAGFLQQIVRFLPAERRCWIMSKIRDIVRSIGQSHDLSILSRQFQEYDELTGDTANQMLPKVPVNSFLLQAPISMLSPILQ